MNLLTQEPQPELSYRTIELTQGQVALVDAADYDWLSKTKWFAYYCKRMRSFYARRSTWIIGRGRGGVEHMHRAIMRAPVGFVVDHRDGNTLNNRRDNLRVVTQHQNSLSRHKLNRTNTSGYRGVYWSKQRSKWFSSLSVSGKVHWFGFFDTKEKAHEVYEREAAVLLGEFHHTIRKVQSAEV